MALRKRKPTSAGRRFQTVSDFSEITKTRPERTLLAKKSSTGGRNNLGRKTARHRGGGHKQRYRIIDFRRTKDGIPAKYVQKRVELSLFDLEADPAESVNLAAKRPEIVSRLFEAAERARAELGDSALKRDGRGVRPPGRG